MQIVTVRACAARALLAEAIGPRTWLVAFSLVQSATGELADVDVDPRGRAAGTASAHFADLTQAAGWLSGGRRRGSTSPVCTPTSGCAPRADRPSSPWANGMRRRTAAGAGRLVRGRRPVAVLLRPGDRTSRADARRFDVSPAWPVWPGTAAALEFFATLDIAAVHAPRGRTRRRAVRSRSGIPRARPGHRDAGRMPTARDLAALTSGRHPRIRARRARPRRLPPLEHRGRRRRPS